MNAQIQTAAPPLELRGVSKSFPGVKALDDISLAINRHEVVGIIGENGAGKTSLLKVLNGIYQAIGGQLLVDGKVVKLASPRHAFDFGIAMVFQEQSILPSLTVAENIFLGREEEFLRYGLISKARMNEAASVELKKVHLDVHPGTACSRLTFADRQMVEIAKALSLDSRINGNITILLDEPTSVLERKEVELLFEIIADLKKRASIAFISHRLDEVLAVTDRIYVLRDGKVVKELARKARPRRTCINTWSGASSTPNTTAKRARPFRGRRFSSKRAASARPALSRMSPSSCMKERCWALPASSARAARISPAASRATRRPMPERSKSTAGRPGSPPSRMRPHVASAWFRPNARSRAWSPSSAWRKT